MRNASIGLGAILALTLASSAFALGSPGPSGERASNLAPPFASSASGRCSKAEATTVVKQLGLSDPSVESPVFKVLCGAFAGPGSETMVVSLFGPANTGMIDWVVLRRTGGTWTLLLKRHQAALLSAAGSDIRETVAVFRVGDSRCCPSGGEKARVWRWNGSRLVAGPWNRVTKGESDRRAFYSPSGNLSCDLGPRGVVCTSRKPPLVVSMGIDGRLTICRGIACIGNAGVTDAQPTPTLLAYGRQITVGRFRCVSLESGVRCTVIQSGKGFLINRDGVSRVGQ